MGAFGFFLFLSVVVIASAWRSVSVARIRQEALVRIIESGQPVSLEHLEALSANPPKLIPYAEFKIGVLVLMGVGAMTLSLVYWEAGTLPVLVAGLTALLVAFATWSNARRAKRYEGQTMATQSPSTSGLDRGNED